MPGHGGLILCNGYQPVAATHDMSAMDMAGMDMPGMDMSGHSGHGGNSPSPDHENMGVCPFAAAATAMAAQQATAVAVLVHFVSTAVEIHPQPFVPRGTIVPTRLPRGPPTLLV